MLIALSSTCIQTFSIRLASHADHLRGSSRAPDEPLRTWEASVRNAPALSAIRHVACKAPDDPFWAGMQELLRLSNNITFWIRQLKKKLEHLSKKVIIPAPFRSKAFVLLNKFAVTNWTLLDRLSRGLFCFVLFFTNSGASAFRF